MEASYLIATPKGLTLVNSGLQASIPLIRKSVETLGSRFRDINILLISHAHNDHCGGSAEIVRLTGALYEVMDADVPVVESGGKADFQYGAEEDMLYPPTRFDRVLHDGDTVRLGGTVLTAHLTAGHTKGTTTWTMNETEAGRAASLMLPITGRHLKRICNSNGRPSNRSGAGDRCQDSLGLRQRDSSQQKDLAARALA